VTEFVPVAELDAAEPVDDGTTEELGRGTDDKPMTDTAGATDPKGVGDTVEDEAEAVEEALEEALEEADEEPAAELDDEDEGVEDSDSVADSDSDELGVADGVADEEADEEALDVAIDDALNDALAGALVDDVVVDDWGSWPTLFKLGTLPSGGREKLHCLTASTCSCPPLLIGFSVT